MMSAGPRGVVIVAKKFLRHRTPAITGKEPSVAPFCIPEAAIKPAAALGFFDHGNELVYLIIRDLTIYFGQSRMVPVEREATPQ